MHPSGTSGTNVQAVLGPAQLKLRTMAECGLEWIAALTGLERIADRTPGTFQYADSRISLDGLENT
eukprot:10157196-Alexandrium_andersonii.AAC.1